MWRTSRGSRRAAGCVLAAVLGFAAVVASPADARPKTDVIVLPGADSAEGIAAGRGHTFYAGELFTGDIFRGDLRRGTASRLIDAPDGRWAVGMDFHQPTGLLAVAGGPTGDAYVYDTATGRTVAVLELADPATGPTFVNDVTVTREGAWFTDSNRPQLSFVPLSRAGAGRVTTLALSGPAAEVPGDFNLNGIAATPNGKVLLVAHSANGAVYTVDPRTGASAPIAGVDVPDVDGLVLEGRRLWAVQNVPNQVSVFRLAGDLRSGTLERVITSPSFQFPTTAAVQGSTLAVVNARFDTGFPPDPDLDYEVVLVRR